MRRQVDAHGRRPRRCCRSAPRRCCSASCACSDRRLADRRRGGARSGAARAAAGRHRHARRARGARPARRTAGRTEGAADGVDAAYVTSCDVPLLVPGLRRAGCSSCSADHDIAVMEIDGFPHPLSAVYRRVRCRRSKRCWRRIGCVRCSCSTPCARGACSPPEMTVVDPDLRTLRNLNTREDYLAALSRAGY